MDGGGRLLCLLDHTSCLRQTFGNLQVLQSAQGKGKLASSPYIPISTTLEKQNYFTLSNATHV